MRIDTTVLAIDPTDCGCPECIVGEYVTLNRATTDHIQAMFLGIIGDNTCTTWTITQNDDDTLTVSADDRQFTIDHIALPITVDRYTLDVNPATVATHRHRLGPNPTDTTPVILGKPTDAPV